MRTRFLTHALIAIVAALVLAGCGEKEEPSTAGPVVPQTTTGGSGGGNQQTTPGPDGGGGATSVEAEIERTVVSYLAKPGNPAACDELITPAFLKRSYGDRAGCVAAQRESGLANGVVLDRVSVRNEAAVVTAKPQGGVFSGETLKVTVVQVGNGWRIDRISSNAPVGP